MSLRPWLSTALGACAALLFTATAQAQTVYLKNNNEGVVRGASYNPALLQLNWFNQANCVDNEKIRFNINISGSSAVTSLYHLEAWIGTACDDGNNRKIDSINCRRIGAVGANVEAMELWLRDMVGPITGTSSEGTGGTGGTGGTSGTGGSAGVATGGTAGLASGGTTGLETGGTTGLGTGGTTGLETGGSIGSGGVAGTVSTGGVGAAAGLSAFAETAGAGDEITDTVGGLEGPASVDGEQPISVCEPGSGTVPSDRTLYFMLLNSDGQAPTTIAPPPTTSATTGTSSVTKWAFKYDMAGPPAPVSIQAGIGESALVMKWTQSADAPIDLKQYWFLCDPPPGSVADTGGAGESSTPPSTLCKTNALIAGEVPSYDTIQKYQCGHVQSTGTEGEASPLENNHTYAVGLFSRDGFDNAGPVSEVVCGTPQLVTDFYEAYRAAGGKGGGGFCSIGRVRTHALTALFAFGAIGLVVRRRMRRTGDRRSRS